MLGKKGRAETCQFPPALEARTGATSLSVGVFGKCRYLIYSANKVSESTSTDANRSAVIIESLTESKIKVGFLEEAEESKESDV